MEVRREPVPLPQIAAGCPPCGELQPAADRGVWRVAAPDRGRGREEPDPHHQLLAHTGL